MEQGLHRQGIYAAQHARHERAGSIGLGCKLLLMINRVRVITDNVRSGTTQLGLKAWPDGLLLVLWGQMGIIKLGVVGASKQHLFSIPMHTIMSRTTLLTAALARSNAHIPAAVYVVQYK